VKTACGMVSPAILLTFLSNCELLDPDYQARTDSFREVRLVIDTAEVRHLINAQNSLVTQDLAETRVFINGEASIYREIDKRPGNPSSQADAKRQLHVMLAHSERYVPERVAFIDAMTRAPGVAVTRNSYCRIVERSEAICSKDPIANPRYVKVHITSGPSKGSEGWGCLGDGIGLTVAMP